jgi:acyl carrier protein
MKMFTKDEIESMLFEILASNFEIEEIDLDYENKLDNYVSSGVEIADIADEIEDEFSISCTEDEVESAKDVQSLMDLVEKKLDEQNGKL